MKPSSPWQSYSLNSHIKLVCAPSAEADHPGRRRQVGAWLV